MIQRPDASSPSLSERFLGVVMRQTEESTLAGEAALKALAAAKTWRAATDDKAAVEAIEHLQGLDDQARWQVQRALLMAIELSHQPSEDPFPALADTLREAGMKPLPKRPFPPYPQLFLHFALGEPFFSAAQHQAFAVIDRLADDPDQQGELDAELMRLWQIADRESGSSALDEALSDWLMPALAAVNDDFANAVHIDPRFANFVPFAAYAGHQSAPDSAQSKGLALRALAKYHAEMSKLYHEFAQDRAYALGGDRLESLRQRLTLSAPALAQMVEAKLQSRPLQLSMAMMLAKLEASFWKWSAAPTGFYESQPQIKPLWPKEKLTPDQGYSNAAGFLRDLKHLHQAVGELYGGVALAPRVRRVLMTCGGHGFRGLSQELVLAAGRVVGDLSELAMRAKVLDEPIDAYPSGDQQKAALEKLFANIDKLAEWADAGATSQSVKEMLSQLATIRQHQREVDSEATSMILLEDCVQAADAISLLALLHIDHRRDPKKLAGRPLYETLSIIPELAPSLDAEASAGLIGELCAFEPYQAYFASRGGHGEVALARDPSPSPLVKAWRDEAAMLLMLDRARESEVVLTFMLDADDLAAIPAGALNCLVRLRVKAGVDTTYWRPRLAESALRDQLTRVTTSVYLAKESENAPAYRGLLRALASHSQEAADSIYQALEEASDGKVDGDAIEAWTRPWLGVGSALRAFLDGRLAMEGAPQEEVARVAMVRAAMLESPRFSESLNRMKSWCDQNDLRVLSLQAYRTLPKGTFGAVFPLLEEEFSVLNACFDEIGMSHDGESCRRGLEDALWLLELANWRG